MAPNRVPHSRPLVSGLLMAALGLALSACAARTGGDAGDYPPLLPIDEILAQAEVAPASP